MTGPLHEGDMMIDGKPYWPVETQLGAADAVEAFMKAFTPPGEGRIDDTCATCGHASENHYLMTGKCFLCPAKQRCAVFVERKVQP